MNGKEQHEITRSQDLLDARGRLSEAGYAKSLILNYHRSAIKAPGFRIKEWDYYLIACDDFAVALTIDDNSYMGLDSISLLDFRIPCGQVVRNSGPLQVMMGALKWILCLSLTGQPSRMQSWYPRISTRYLENLQERLFLMMELP